MTGQGGDNTFRSCQDFSGEKSDRIESSMRDNTESLPVETKACRYCGEDFTRPYDLSNANWATKRFCSRACSQYYRRKGCSLADTGEDMPTVEEVACHALLRRLIGYGLRYDRHLGMGADAFMARARELGMAS